MGVGSSSRLRSQGVRTAAGPAWSIAEQRDGSVAELARRGMEAYVQTCPEPSMENAWTMPPLRGSGGHRVDPAGIKAEAEAIVARFAQGGQGA